LQGLTLYGHADTGAFQHSTVEIDVELVESRTDGKGI